MKWPLLLLAAVVIKSVLWVIVVPVFQTPDEQAHFAQLQWYAENKNINLGQLNLSEEVAIVEETLGTRRDGQGNNKYTYHPEYKNNSVIPKLPIESRTQYVDREAAGYPPLYYLLDIPFYYLGDLGELGDVGRRVMTSRLLSVICHLGLVLLAYFIGKIIWQEKWKSYALAVMVGFQPMVSFVAAGIHPDNLLNLISTAMVLICFLIVKGRFGRLGGLAVLGLLGVLGWETKPAIIFLFPAVLTAAYPKFFLLTLGIPAAAFVFRWPVPYMPAENISGITLLDYLKFRIPKLVFEMWPWFWGVFKWLGVTLPAITMKIITRATLISAIGLIIGRGFKNKHILMSILFVAAYLLYLFLWDWRLMQSMGYSQGLQGRYLFPVIVPIMVILLGGLGRFGWLGAVGMILLNGFSLWFINSLY
jgi:hypothetical protein